MAAFTRKNLIVCSGTFTPSDGSATAPTNAEMVVTYTNVNGGQSTDTIELTLTGAVWGGTWDSTKTKGGRVDWMAHCWGGLQASVQGSFEVLANAANVS